MGVTQTVDIGAAGNVQVSTNSAAADVAADVFSFDDVYVTSGLYSGATP